MRKQTRQIPVLVQERQQCFYAEWLEMPEASAVAASREGALDAVVRVVESVFAANPEAGRRLPGEDGAPQDAPPPVPQLRHLELAIPVMQAEGLAELELRLAAVCTPVEGQWHVYLPELGLEFESPGEEDIEDVCLEHIRSRLELEERLDTLAQLGTTLIARAGKGARPAPGLVPPAANSTQLELCSLTVRVVPQKPAKESDEALYPTLAAVAEPLHRRIDRKDTAQAFERRSEIQTLMDFVTGFADRSVLLVGPQGAGKTAIVRELVWRTLRGEVPEWLKDRGVWQISGGRLMAGMRFLGQWQDRVLQLIDEVRTSGGILYAENLVELLESSGNERHAEGIPGMLLPHIQAGDIVLVAEIRPEQLALAEQRHPSFLRALRRLPVEPLTPARTDTVLERQSFRLGREYGVRLSPEARQKILELVGRFRTGGQLPGPAVELAERMARTWRVSAARPQTSEEGDGGRMLLLPEHAIEAYTSLTGLPPELIDPGRPFAIDHVREHFDKAIFGQPEASQAMVDLVTVIRAGLNPPERPLGSFLFLGPTGVGKTRTALTLARYLFGSADRILRFDMSEYQDSWSAGRLVGRYKGQSGDLTRRLREQPFQILLLDEIEKAHPSVFDILLQMLGEGRLSDALGQSVSANSTVIIMTSNLGARGPSTVGFESRDEDSARRHEERHYRSAVENFFRPEFVGRIDRLVAFRSLGRDTSRALVEHALREAFGREGLVRRQIRVRATEEVIEHLIRVGFAERYGARPLRQAVENLIVAPLADFLTRHADLRNLELEFRLVDGLPRLHRMEGMEG